MHELDSILDCLIHSIAQRDLPTTLLCMTHEAVVLGSEKGEEVRGVDELELFFRRVFAKDGVYRFQFTDRIWTVRQDVAWLVSNGIVVEPVHSTPKAYRLVAVFERQNPEWKMALWSGTEPA